TALKEFFSIALDSGFQAVTLFRLQTIEGKDNGAAAAFESLSISPFVAQEMCQRMQQKRPEPAPCRVGHRELISSQKRSEERLCQISGGFGIVAAPPNKHVERIPIRTTKFVQRRRPINIVGKRRFQD